MTQHRRYRPEEGSSRQRQRVAIAGARMSELELVNAGEPTATRTVRGMMAALNREMGAAFVFATHDRALDELASGMGSIRDGKLELLGIGAHA